MNVFLAFHFDVYCSAFFINILAHSNTLGFCNPTVKQLHFFGFFFSVFLAFLADGVVHIRRELFEYCVSNDLVDYWQIILKKKKTSMTFCFFQLPIDGVEYSNQRSPQSGPRAKPTSRVHRYFLARGPHFAEP